MQDHYVVLSRKYRPKDLKDLIGQEVLASSLRKSIENNRIPHAFLLHGIRGIGKTTTARIISRCLNCLGEDGNTFHTISPCGVCKSCKAIDIDQHMDVIEIDAASKTGVDDIRELIESTQYAPFMKRYKIFIIDEVHMLSKSAFNAILKTLEEPPAHVKFIFATTELNKIPDTILSRCMTFNLKPVPRNVIAAYISDISSKELFEMESEVAEIISEESEGSMRDALSLLEQAIMLSLDTKKITVDLINEMLGSAKKSDILELMRLIFDAKPFEATLKIMNILESGADPMALYKDIQSILYKAIFFKMQGSCSDQSFESIYKAQSLSNLYYLWQILLNQMSNLKHSANPDHVLVVTVSLLAKTAGFGSIDDISINNSASQQPQANPNVNVEASDLINDIMSKFKGSIITEVN